MNPIVSYLLAAVTIVSFAGTALVYLRGSADKGTIASLENSVSALKTEGEIKDQKIARLEGEDLRKDGQIAQMGEQIRTLTAAVTQKAGVEALQTSLDSHHSESMKVLEQIRDSVVAA